MAALSFTKMHGLGNDFVLLDGRSQELDLGPANLQHLADRRTGIGCDQVLVIEADGPSGYWRYRVFNPDGSEVEQCGNGVRCVARWLFDRGEIQREATLIGGAGPMQTTVLDNGQVAVMMGQPDFTPSNIPMASQQSGPEHQIEAAQQTFSLTALSMGNPHAVLEVDCVDSAAVETIGPALQSHATFPLQVNVGFAQVTGASSLRLRVFERGAGETQACGSGACAAAVAMILRGRVSSPVTVELPGGSLLIQWPDPQAQVMMTGDAAYAFRGEIHR